ncbi:MAG: phosphonate C-P lyase system protein PhnH [Alphaproteobacteria bacterium]|nr:phosphonate C-P lyase system protein PhnH [Alphaproteobacteria bacterium]
MSTHGDLLPGFDDYGSEANAVFRTCLTALSRPGLIQDFAPHLEAPAPLLPGAAAVLLTLADYETTFWLDATLARVAAVADFLRFHTGARQIDDAADADFAVIADPLTMPALSDFKLGTPEFPDRSTTLIVQVEQLQAAGMTFRGPGIKDRVALSASPLTVDFARQLAANRQAFPCGVDVIFVAPSNLAALPRSVNLLSEA